MFIKNINNSCKVILLGTLLLIMDSCSETNPDIYYGFTLTFKSDVHPEALYYRIPQPSTNLSIQDSGANYNMLLALYLTDSRVIEISATNVNINTYSFRDSAVTMNLDYSLVGLPENNYATDHYSLAEGSIHFLSLDTADFHCIFNYKFTYRNTFHLNEPGWTNNIEITNAEVRIKK